MDGLDTGACTEFSEWDSSTQCDSSCPSSPAHASARRACDTCKHFTPLHAPAQPASASCTDTCGWDEGQDAHSVALTRQLDEDISEVRALLDECDSGNWHWGPQDHRRESEPCSSGAPGSVQGGVPTCQQVHFQHKAVQAALAPPRTKSRQALGLSSLQPSQGPNCRGSAMWAQAQQRHANKPVCESCRLLKVQLQRLGRQLEDNRLRTRGQVQAIRSLEAASKGKDIAVTSLKKALQAKQALLDSMYTPGPVSCEQAPGQSLREHSAALEGSLQESRKAQDLLQTEVARLTSKVSVLERGRASMQQHLKSMSHALRTARCERDRSRSRAEEVEGGVQQHLKRAQRLETRVHHLNQAVRQEQSNSLAAKQEAQEERAQAEAVRDELAETNRRLLEARSTAEAEHDQRKELMCALSATEADACGWKERASAAEEESKQWEIKFQALVKEKVALKDALINAQNMVDYMQSIMDRVCAEAAHPSDHCDSVQGLQTSS